MTVAALLKRRDAQLPIALALGALLLIFGYAVFVGTEPQPDEGAAAHLFQLLMLVQVGAIVVFAARWLPREPRAGATVVAIQLLSTTAAFFPVWYFQF